jgi:homoserine O-succinyltransferase
MIELTNVWEADGRCLHIGLVNNMPDSSLEATERQFQTLLCEAAEGMTVRLSLLALPEVPRSDKARQRISATYTSLSALWDRHLDGPIVTGAEPVAANLNEEPFWTSLTQLMDWAGYNTYSSVWSCLAAHAAVLAMDGIRRRPIPDKLFGVFDCVKVSDHPLTAGVPSHFRTPHSRWNNVCEDALAGCGYRLLSRLKAGGADTFVKQRNNSLFVFFQGHPEYEAVSLSLEYRRDIRRYLGRERETYPSMPQGYYDEDAITALTNLRTRALADRRQETFADFPPANVRCSWRGEAVRWYRNWLQHLSEEKHKRQASQPRRTQYEFKTAVASAASGGLASEAEVR